METNKYTDLFLYLSEKTFPDYGMQVKSYFEARQNFANVALMEGQDENIIEGMKDAIKDINTKISEILKL